MLIEKADLVFDVTRLRDEYTRMLADRPYAFDYENRFQISLVHSFPPDMPADVSTAINEGRGERAGPFQNHPRGRYDFRYFDQRYADWYVGEVYRRVEAWSPNVIGRMRFLVRPPRTCYWFHRDLAIRYHIAIVTDEDCFFAFRAAPIQLIPANGHLYKVNTMIDHTVVNAGVTDRVHLVFDLLEPK